jgi:hypothetical protein
MIFCGAGKGTEKKFKISSNSMLMSRREEFCKKSYNFIYTYL